MFTHIIDKKTELRLLHDQHAEELFALVDSNREYLRQWLPWLDYNVSVEDSRQFIKNTLQYHASGDGFNAGIWFEGRIAGAIGFHKTDWKSRCTNIGYWLGESYQGNGLATKACRALIDYIFHDMRLNRVEILCASENIKSQAIPERLKFTNEGTLRQAEWLYDHFVDLIVYGILASEWR